MTNGKSYTEVLLEVHDKLDEMERRTITRLDGVQKGVNGNTVALARVETKMTAVCDNIDGHDDDIDDVRKDVTSLKRENKIVGGINGIFTGLVAIIVAFLTLER